jgi:glutamine synthetase type III
MGIQSPRKYVVSFRITRGNVHNAKRFYPLVREAAEKHDIEKLYADRAYDNRRILTY